VIGEDLSSLEGHSYGSVRWPLSDIPIRDFMQLTGDDPERWSHFAPPGFAAAALFTIAPDLLETLHEHSVIHGEQSFAWYQPLPNSGELDVSGEVTRVRERGAVHFVTFEMEARNGSEVVLTGRSLFLASGAPASQDQETARHEPHHSYAGNPRHGELAASRADLVRYASATRDWNPVHWDHEAGVAAGFPGVVVHGLLQAAWALRVASVGTTSTRPFKSARFRFRNPLLPARPATYTVEPGHGSLEVVIADEDRDYLTATVALADE
jgi:acyl dehydratase